MSDIALAAEPSSEPTPARATPAATALSRSGRPTVKLDRLELPPIPGARHYKKYLKRVLQREVRKADWGAGRDSTIEYRFSVDKLVVVAADKVLRVRCEATGRLPKGKTAKSQLTFSGDPTKKGTLIKEVLAIVARGVITRLADMERARRAEAAN